MVRDSINGSVVVAPAAATLPWFSGLLALTAIASGTIAGSPAPATAVATSAAASASAPSDAAIVDAAELRRFVARFHGKVVLIDFWATWCAPCVKGLPRLAELQRRFGSQDFQVIAVSFDAPREWPRHALPVLRRAGWDGPAFVTRDRQTQLEIVDWLGSDWRSELPAQYLLSRAGKPVAEVIEKTADSMPPLEQLIAEQIKANSATRSAP